jgi:hypothetical protein
MDWTQAEKEKLDRVVGSAKDEADLVLAVADKAVELVAARGGTMTLQQVMMWFAMYRDQFPVMSRHIVAQGSQLAVLGASEKVWRQRVEKAADALSGVAPGELGRLDLVGRIERLKEARETAHSAYKEWAENWGEAQKRIEELEADLARLKPSGQVGVDAALLEALMSRAMPPNENWVNGRAALSRLAAGAQEAESLRAEVERLNDDLEEKDNLIASGGEACDRLETERERLTAEVAEAWAAKGIWKERAESAESRLAAIRERAKDDARWLKEAEAGVVMGDVGEWDEDVHADTMAMHALPMLGRASSRVLHWILGGDEPQEATVGLINVTDRGGTLVLGERGITTLDGTPLHHPGSPTCTHPDAATPGHPERVKERSEAVKEALGPLPKLGLYGPSETAAWEAGTEAMRAACLETGNLVLMTFGIPLDSPCGKAFKAAIEGAAP